MRRSQNQPHDRKVNSCSSFVLVLGTSAISSTRTKDEDESVRSFRSLMLLFIALFLLAGCASPQPQSRAEGHHFAFGQDSFAYANELVWRYDFDPVTGKMTHVPQQPKPEYTHHCFV